MTLSDNAIVIAAARAVFLRDWESPYTVPMPMDSGDCTKWQCDVPSMQ